MTIRKKTSKKKSRRKNPAFLDKILGRQKALHDASTVTVDEGFLTIKGKNHLKVAAALDEALSLDVKEVEVRFTPRASSKGYIINRPKDVIRSTSIDESTIERARRRMSTIGRI